MDTFGFDTEYNGNNIMDDNEALFMDWAGEMREADDENGLFQYSSFATPSAVQTSNPTFMVQQLDAAGSTVYPERRETYVNPQDIFRNPKRVRRAEEAAITGEDFSAEISEEAEEGAAASGDEEAEEEEEDEVHVNPQEQAEAPAPDNEPLMGEIPPLRGAREPSAAVKLREYQRALARTEGQSRAVLDLLDRTEDNQGLEEAYMINMMTRNVVEMLAGRPVILHRNDGKDNIANPKLCKWLLEQAAIRAPFATWKKTSVNSPPPENYRWDTMEVQIWALHKESNDAEVVQERIFGPIQEMYKLLVEGLTMAVHKDEMQENQSWPVASMILAHTLKAMNFNVEEISDLTGVTEASPAFTMELPLLMNFSVMSMSKKRVTAEEVEAEFHRTMWPIPEDDKRHRAWIAAAVLALYHGCDFQSQMNLMRQTVHYFFSPDAVLREGASEQEEITFGDAQRMRMAYLSYAKESERQREVLPIYYKALIHAAMVMKLTRDNRWKVTTWQPTCSVMDKEDAEVLASMAWNPLEREQLVMSGCVERQGNEMVINPEYSAMVFNRTASYPIRQSFEQIGRMIQLIASHDAMEMPGVQLKWYRIFSVGMFTVVTVMSKFKDLARACLFYLSAFGSRGNRGKLSNDVMIGASIMHESFSAAFHSDDPSSDEAVIALRTFTVGYMCFFQTVSNKNAINFERSTEGHNLNAIAHALPHIFRLMPRWLLANRDYTEAMEEGGELGPFYMVLRMMDSHWDDYHQEKKESSVKFFRALREVLVTPPYLFRGFEDPGDRDRGNDRFVLHNYLTNQLCQAISQRKAWRNSNQYLNAILDELKQCKAEIGKNNPETMTLKGRDLARRIYALATTSEGLGFDESLKADIIGSLRISSDCLGTTATKNTASVGHDQRMGKAYASLAANLPSFNLLSGSQKILPEQEVRIQLVDPVTGLEVVKVTRKRKRGRVEGSATPGCARNSPLVSMIQRLEKEGTSIKMEDFMMGVLLMVDNIRCKACCDTNVQCSMTSGVNFLGGPACLFEQPVESSTPCLGVDRMPNAVQGVRYGNVMGLAFGNKQSLLWESSLYKNSGASFVESTAEMWGRHPLPVKMQ